MWRRSGDHREPARLCCRDAVELLTDYLDGALSHETASRFEEHIRSCDGCTIYVDEMRATIAAAASIDQEQLPLELREQLLGAFRHRYGAADL